jgi:hypothetical protein
MAKQPDGYSHMATAMTSPCTARRPRLSDEAGTTLIETMIACAMLLVVCTGLAGMTTIATSVTENQGHLSSRTTEYAVDKMEQLLELTYGDAQSNTTVFPSESSGGTGLAVGGSLDTAAPLAGYSDYLDQNGNPLCTVADPCDAAPENWYYMRVWKVEVPSANLKKVTVTSTIRTSLGGVLKSSSSVAAFKTNCPSGC